MRNFTMEDFSGAGQYLIRADKPAGEYTNPGFMSTIMIKVGYCRGQGCLNPPQTGNIITLVDMSDGCTSLGYFDTRKDTGYHQVPKMTNSEGISKWVWIPFNGYQALCDYLNNPDFSQEYRFATQEEVVRVVMYQKSRWRN